MMTSDDAAIYVPLQQSQGYLSASFCLQIVMMSSWTLEITLIEKKCIYSLYIKQNCVLLVTNSIPQWSLEDFWCKIKILFYLLRLIFLAFGDCLDNVQYGNVFH